MFKMKNMVFAIAGACMLSTLAVPISVSAAAPTVKELYSKDLLELNPGSGSTEQFLYYAVAKTSSDKVSTVKQWEAVPVVTNSSSEKVAYVDISFVKDKEAYILVSTDRTDANSTMVTIDERKIKLKATFDDKDTIKIENNKQPYDELKIGETKTTSKVTTGAKPESKDYKWKSGKYGQYQDLTALKLDAIERFRAQGATLYFYEVAYDTDSSKTDSGKEWRPSKEFSIKIKKAANAPKVTIDLSKIAVKMSDKMEYKLIKSGSNITTDWVGAEKNPISISKIATSYKTSGTAESVKNDEEVKNKVEFQVRTKAANGKAASKVNIVSIPAQGVRPAAGTDFAITNTEAKAATGSGDTLKPAELAVNKLTPGSVAVEYQLISGTTSPKMSTGWIPLKKEVNFGELEKDVCLYIRKAAVKGAKGAEGTMASLATQYKVTDATKKSLELQDAYNKPVGS